MICQKRGKYSKILLKQHIWKFTKPMKNTQEYINNLLNKQKVPYLDLSSPCQVSQCSHCNKKSWDETKPNLSGEIEDLKEFQNLRGINASNNNFTKLEGLFTLPNKNKLEKINLFGNKIVEIDLSRLFSEFPKLKQINLANNPLRLKNLTSLTDKQLEKLAEGLKSKQIRISLGQGSILADLFELCSKKGNSSTAKKLREALTVNSGKQKETQTGNSAQPWIIGGSIVLGLLLMTLIGYWWGKRKQSDLDDYDDF